MSVKTRVLYRLADVVITHLFEMFSPGEVRSSIGELIDRLDKTFSESDNPYDDYLIPMLSFARGVFGINDMND